MSNIVEKTEKWIKNSACLFTDHLIRTADLIKEINPKANDALVVAALTHDIERVFKDEKPPMIKTWDDPVYLKWHQERSAKFVSDFLEKEGMSQEFINEVAELIKKHEIGGDKDSDLLRDVDSLSFLETVAPTFISRGPKGLTKEQVRGKINYMFNRIKIPKIKKLAESFYKKAIEELERKT